MPFFLATENRHPHLNLAAEEYLFERARETGDVTLFLWRNSSTVVIGRNQNAWRECRVSLLEEEGGVLSRRLSGGGAVYHDLGNLCFTFIAPDGLYDVARQTGLLARAVGEFGLSASLSGRNDVVLDTPDGAAFKFSGNAFRSSGGVSIQHGTILIGVDLGRLSRYLSPPPEKLEGKGIKSVRARVTNLSDHNPLVTPESMADALFHAFGAEYGRPEALDDFVRFDNPALAALYERYASWDFRFGESPVFDAEWTARLSFGTVTVGVAVSNGFVKRARVYSDALDVDLIEALPPLLEGRRLAPSELSDAARPLSPETADWLGSLLL